MARDSKLFKEYRKIHNDNGLQVGVMTYECWLEEQLIELRTEVVNKNDLLQRVSNCKADAKLNKIEEELGILQDIHGEIVKEYETYNKNTQSFRFKDGAVYRIRLDRVTGRATLD